MKKILKIFFCCLLAISFILLAGCQKKQAKSQVSGNKILTVKEQPFTSTMYYSGTIAPLAPIPVNAPVEGAITDKFFEYGDQVEKGQLLFKIKSTAERSQFQDALTNFLQAKQKLETSKNDLTTETELYNQGIVPRNDFEDKQTNYFLNELSFIQAKEQFERELEKRGISKFPELTIKDVDKIKEEIQALREQTEHIVVYAPVTGMILFAKEGYNNRVIVGSQVKLGDVLCFVSKLEEGIAITIKVNEIEVNHIQINQKATVTGEAFPDLVLQGFVQSIIKQASSTGGIAEFVATISVPDITPEQRLILHVGMNSKVALTIQGKPQIMVPIDAVINQNDKYFAKLFDEKTGESKEVEVSIGPTTENSVVITEGLKPGDKIVAPNST